MTRDELFAILQKAKSNGFRLDDGASCNACASAMLTFIGDPDAILRDGLIYEAFDSWIENDLFTSGELKQLIDTALDVDHLFYSLNTPNELGVFTRSFSALLISSVLQKNAAEHFLSTQELANVTEVFTRYYIAESDLRGFVPEYGWAHSTAHGADVIKAIADCDVPTEGVALTLLQAIKAKICQGNHVYIDREPERICAAVCAILAHSPLSQREFLLWLEEFAQLPLDFDDVTSWHRSINIQSFFKTLYFSLKKRDLNHYALSWLECNIRVL